MMQDRESERKITELDSKNKIDKKKSLNIVTLGNSFKL